MQHKCQHCHRHFDLADRASFCPYCGWALMSDLDINVAAPQKQSDLVDVVDSIWGVKAQLKNQLRSAVKAFMQSLEETIQLEVKAVLPLVDSQNFSATFTRIQQSPNRKILLAKIEKWIYEIKCAIESEPAYDEQVIERIIDQSLEVAYTRLQSIASHFRVDLYFKELPGLSNKIQINYSFSQLMEFWSLVDIAHQKYVRCVIDNNMFAAFPSDSNYGVCNWKYQFTPIFDWDDEIKGNDLTYLKSDLPNYLSVYQELNDANKQPYRGLLDEDFAPHVNAFWAGIKNLTAMIDNRISFDLGRLLANLEKIKTMESTLLSVISQISSEQMTQGMIKLEAIQHELDKALLQFKADGEARVKK